MSGRRIVAMANTEALDRIPVVSPNYFVRQDAGGQSLPRPENPMRLLSPKAKLSGEPIYPKPVASTISPSPRIGSAPWRKEETK